MQQTIEVGSRAGGVKMTVEFSDFYASLDADSAVIPPKNSHRQK
jgi:hypothetical protein